MLNADIPDIIRDLNDKINAAQTPHKRHRSDWTDYAKYVDGDGQADKLKGGLPDNCTQDLTIINVTKALLDTMVAMLVLAAPKWYVASADEGREPEAQNLTDWMQQMYYSRNFAIPQWQCYTDVTRLGNGFLKPYLDMRENPPRVRIDAVSPHMVVPDPTAKRLEDCEFVALRNVYSRPAAMRMWGEDRIDWDRVDPVTEGDNIGPTNKGIDQQSTIEQVMVWEVYHEFGAQQTIFSGNQIIHDRASPIPNQRFPLVHFEMWPDETSLWSDSIVAQAEYAQDEINKLRTRLATWFRFYVNPAVITDDPELVMDLSPGGKTEVKTPESQVEPWTPPSLPPEVFQHIHMLQASLDVLVGVHEVERGIRPKGLTSGISLEVLQRAGRTRQAGPSLFWGNQWGKVGQMLLELMQRYYAEERTQPVVSGGEVEVLRLNPGQLAVNGGTEPHNFQVVVQSEGKLPRSEIAQAETALQIAGLVPWDLILPELLDAVEFPGKHKVVQRYQQILNAQTEGQQQAAEAAAAAQQATAEAAAEQAEQQAAPAAPQQQQAAPQEAPPAAPVGRPDEQRMQAIADQLIANLGEERYAQIEQARQQGLTLQEVPQLAAGAGGDTNLIELIRMYLRGDAGL